MRNRVRKVDFVARPNVCGERESLRNIAKEWMTTDLAVSERLQQESVHFTGAISSSGDCFEGAVVPFCTFFFSSTLHVATTETPLSRASNYIDAEWMLFVVSYSCDVPSCRDNNTQEYEQKLGSRT